MQIEFVNGSIVKELNDVGEVTRSKKYDNLISSMKEAQIMNDNDLIQYHIINKDLNMSIGKIAAQVSHGSTIMAIKYGKLELFQQWLNNIKRVVTLKATEKEMLKLHDQLPLNIKIIDKGFTEIPENSFTVLTLPIMTRIEAKQYIKKLQLL